MSNRFWLAPRNSFAGYFWLSMVEANGEAAAREGVPVRDNPYSYAVEREHWERGHMRERRRAALLAEWDARRRERRP